MKKILVLAAVVAVGFAVNASAFTFDKAKLTYGAMPFYSMPTGDAGDVLNSSLGLGVSADYLLQDNIKVGLELGYAFGYEFDANSDYSFSVLNIGPVAKYFVTRDMLTFYGVAGIELYHSSLNKTVAGYDSSSDLGLNLGGGIGYEVNKNMTAGAELRYHTVGGDLDADFINLGFKLDYKF